MKISAEYKNPNLYEIAKKREADGNGAADLQMNKDRSPVQVDISKEAMQKYRAELQKNTAAEEESIIKAGTTFRDMFASSGQTNTTAISDILAKISLW